MTYGPWGLCCAHVLTNISWLTIDTRPPYFDMAGHAIVTLRILGLPFLTDPLSAIDGLLHLNQYPPLVYWLAAPVAGLFGRTVDVMTAVNTTFFCALILSTAAIARRLASPRAGLLAAFLVSMYPILYGLSRQFLLDVPLTAITTLGVWLLLRTEGFSRSADSLWLGLVIGLGMLTKWTFPVYFAGPMLIVLAGAAWREPRRSLLNAGKAVLVGAAVMAPWYTANIPQIKHQMHVNTVFGVARGAPPVGSLDAWLFYAQAVIGDQLFVPLAVLWAAGLVVIVVKRRDGAAALLFAWTAVTYVVMSMYGPKDIRYTMPFLPAGAITSALAIETLHTRWFKRTVVTTIVVWCLIEFAGVTWGLVPVNRDGQFPRYVLCGKSYLTYYSEQVHVANPATAHDWRVDEILRDINGPTRFGAPDSPPAVTVIPNVPYFESNGFEYYAAVEDRPLRVYFVASAMPVADALERLTQSDYIVAKTGDQGPAYTLHQVDRWNALLRDPASELGREYTLVATYALPDGSAAELYRRR